MSFNGRVYILITWPESQDFMDAPGAFLVLDSNIAGSSAYMVPEDVFQNYIVPTPEEGSDDYDGCNN